MSFAWWPITLAFSGAFLARWASHVSKRSRSMYHGVSPSVPGGFAPGDPSGTSTPSLAVDFDWLNPRSSFTHGPVHEDSWSRSVWDVDWNNFISFGAFQMHPLVWTILVRLSRASFIGFGFPVASFDAVPTEQPWEQSGLFQIRIVAWKWPDTYRYLSESTQEDSG